MYSNSQIPLSNADITDLETNAVLEVLNSKRLALGPKLSEFETKMAEYTGRKYALAVNSGTSALHLLIRALGLKPGDEVITTPFSFVSSANCILFEGATPVFVDIDENSLNIDPEKIEAAITPNTKAMVIVDIFGNPADWDKILQIAQKYNLKVIEDSCEAIGSEYKGIKCGKFGDAATFAFYPNKQITTCGEGGMIVTDDENIANLARSMHNQGRAVENGAWLEHVRLGYNYRMNETQAAMGIVQLSRINEIIEKRNKVADQYNKLLRHVPGIIIPYIESSNKISWFVYVVTLNKKYTRQDRDLILNKLNEQGIGCSNYFQCIHLQPFYKSQFNYNHSTFPIAESVSDRTIALPFFNDLTNEQIVQVVDALKSAVKTTQTISPYPPTTTH